MQNERNINHKNLRGSVWKTYIHGWKENQLYSLIIKILQVENKPPPKYGI